MNCAEIDLSLKREKSLFVGAPDGKKIFTIHNQAGDTPSDKLVIIAHGFAAWPYEYMHQMARDYFNDHGYDVVRLSFYYDHPDCRKLDEATIDHHGKDLNAVIDHYRSSYNNIYVCGHSRGGTAMLLANPVANALSFWDPSYMPGESMKNGVGFARCGEYYLMSGRMKIVLGKDQVEEMATLTHDYARTLAEKVKTPSQVIVAENSFFKNNPETLYKDLTCEKSRFEVIGAGHMFAEGKTVHDMLTATHNWFERF